MSRVTPLSAFLLALSLAIPATAPAATLGSDRAACAAGNVPAIRANITGLKDRTGRLKLELYPDNEADWLAHGDDLEAAGKTFHRIWAAIPPRGAVSICIKVPHPGRYALLFTHDRDGKNKFNFWKDGAGVPSNKSLGRSKPKVSMAAIEVGSGVTVTNIKTQYLHGLLGGFHP